MPLERRVLATLVGQYIGPSRGIFDLPDGRRVQVEGVVAFGSADAPAPGENAFIVLDESGRALRWEPYVEARLRRRRE